MSERKADGIPAVGRRRLVLLAAYLGAGLVGYGLAVSGVVVFGGKDSSTPLARVGFALREAKPSGTPADWAALHADLELLRANSAQAERGPFDLVVALRGLESGGAPDFARAGQICRELRWPHCDQRALDMLERRSRP